MLTIFLRLVLAVLVLVVASCASKKAADNEAVVAELNKPFEIFEKAVKSITNNNYEQAISLLQLLEQNFPFEKFSVQAQLELIYAYFKNRNFVAANATIDRFIKLRRGNKNMDYAYYMRGMVSYVENSSLSGSVIALDITARDLGSATESLAHFTEFLELYPNSKYVADASKRLEFLRNVLARQEINVANFYLKRQAYLAAIARGKFVVENFQQSPAVPDGFAMMYLGYKILAMDDFAQEVLKVLQASYPEHPVLKYVGKANEVARLKSLAKQEDSLLNLFTLGILNKPKLAIDTRVIYNQQYQKSEKSIVKDSTSG